MMRDEGSMDRVWTWVQFAGVMLIAWWAGLHSAYRVLLVMQAVDVVSGVLAAGATGTLRSRIGHVGIRRKGAAWLLIMALAYMRGMNIDNTILIFEEAQNSTPNQMKLLLTRIGYNSKFFISGDLEQTDRYKDKKQTGLWDALQRFKNVDDIGVFEFSDKDVVRNPLISKLLKRYEE